MWDAGGGITLVLVIARHALPQFAVVRIARHDGLRAAQIGRRPFKRVEPQVGFPLLRVLAMAGKTLVRQDRTNVAIERQIGRSAASAA